MIHCATYITNFANAQSLIGSWVGAAQQLDSGFVCPLPLYFQVRSDSTYTLSLIDGAAVAPRSTWSLANGRLRLDTAVFRPQQVRLTDTELSITGAFPMQFRRVHPGSKSVTEVGVRALLTNRIWQQSQVRYHFHAGGQACLEDVRSGDRAIRCWTVAERDGAVFIIVKGNQIDCSRNYEAPMQVFQLAGNQLTINTNLPQSTQSGTLTAGGTLLPGTTCAAVGFQLCSACLYLPYEQAGALSKKGPPGRFYAVRQRLLADFKPAGGSLTGMVQVRCLVNCVGQAGRFTATTYGPDYQPSQPNAQITNQILTIMRTHFASGWQPGRVRDVSRPLDYVATIHVRLVDGRITDIFP